MSPPRKISTWFKNNMSSSRTIQELASSHKDNLLDLGKFITKIIEDHQKLVKASEGSSSISYINMYWELIKAYQNSIASFTDLDNKCNDPEEEKSS